MARMVYPTKGTLTSQYGHRSLNGRLWHYGIDIANAEGTPVHAAAAGTVIYTGVMASSTGNMIVIKHANNVITGYMHLSKILVTKGTPVGQSVKIGLMGNTGIGSTGSHLHFEVQVGDKWVFGDGSDGTGQRGVDGRPAQSRDPLQGWVDPNITYEKYPNGGYGDLNAIDVGIDSVAAKFVPPSASHPSAKYAATINEAAQKYNFDPYLIAAIIQVESGWNPSIVNPSSGATGLMQIMVDTAKDVGLDPNQRLDPVKNIMYGTKYLREVVIGKANVGNKTEDLTRGYNMGPYGYMWVTTNSPKAKQSHRNAYNSKENTNYYPKVQKAYKELTGRDIPVVIPTYGSGGGGSYGSIDFDLSGNSIGSMNTIGEQFSHTNSLTRIAGISPNPNVDNYPKHRYQQNPFTLRIGDSQFFIPPINIQHSKVGATGHVPTMRHRTGMLNKSGWTEGQLVMSMKFADIEQINGYKVDAPDNRKYHMDGVRSLLAQFHKNPMLPIRNEYINNALGIYNVIVKDIIVSTVEGFPDMLDVTIVANECATVPYTGTTEFMYDVCFNYPVWRWYYHNLLDDNEMNRIESVYLRPIQDRMRSDLFFRILDEYEVDRMQADLVEKAKISGDIKNLNPQYLLSRFKGANLRMLMGAWDLGDIVVTSVSGSISKELSRINMMEYEAPVYQDMGGVHKVFEVNIKMTDRDQVFSLEEMVRQLEKSAREYRHMFVGGFCEVHNDIINMCGVDFCMIEELQTSTTPINGVFEAKIILREFNPNQGNHETLNGIETDVHELYDEYKFTERDEAKYTAHKADRFNTVHEEWMIEKLIKQIELYPDLRLPSYVDANEALEKINTWRRAKGYEAVPFDKFPQPEGDIWVEPDFYFMYPQPIDAFNAMKAGELGTKMINMLDTGTYDGYSKANKWENYLDLAGGASHLLQTFNGTIVENEFNVEESQTATAKQASTNIVYPSTPMYTNFFEEWGSDIQMPDVDVLASYMLYDQVKYDQRLRLTRFFPTYFMLFVDEGAWIDGRRLWNTHYAYHAIHEMTITKDKDNALDFAYIRLSNMYGTFNSDSKMRDPEYYKDFEPRGFVERFMELWGAWGYTAKDIMADARKMMDHANLEVGARIHLRMGNSSNTGNLPTVFNGHVTSVNDGVDIDIFAQSDGVELINGPISANVGDGTPSEPHNTLMKYFTKRMSNYWFTVASDLEFFYNYESFYGIEHFGWVASKEKTDNATMNWINSTFESPEEKAVDTGSMNWFDSLLAGAGQIFGFLGNLAKSTIQNGPSMIVENLQFVVGAITGVPTFLTYDVMKNIFRGDPDNPSTGANAKSGKKWNENTGFWSMFGDIVKAVNIDGEKNIRLSEYGKTVWDIGQTLATFVPEFVFGVHEHGLRSTAFFGMPHWMVKFRYHKPEGAGDDLSKWQEEIKPFQQAHLLSSDVDIIKNDIKASSELLKHIMTAVYTTGNATNSKEGVTVYADKSILKDQQRRTVIDTGVLQDLFGPDSAITFLMTWVVSPVVKSVADIADTALGGLIDLTKLLLPKDIEKKLGIDGKVDLGIAESVSEFMDSISQPGKKQAESVVIGSMQRNFMEMYQGEIITFGMPAMKPLDLFYLNDERRMMSGTVQVGKITHTLSRRTGLISVIKPDLVVSRVDGKGKRNEVLQTIMLAASAASMFTLRYISKTKFAGWLASGTYKKTKALSIKTAKGADWVANRFTGLKPLEHFAKYLDETKIDDWVKTGANWLRRGIVTTVFAGIAVEAFSKWWDKETKYNNVIYIHPLFKAGVPFTAGIKGGMHIIPNYIDPKYYDPTGSGNSKIGGDTKLSLGFDEGADVVGNLASSKPAISTPLVPNKVIGAQPVKNYSGAHSTKVTKDYSKHAVEGMITHPFGIHASQRVTNFNGAAGTYGTSIRPSSPFAQQDVSTIASGTVISTNTEPGKGITVVIQHVLPGSLVAKPLVFYSTYSHLRSGSLMTSAGKTVTAGEKIAVIGSTESSTIKLYMEIHIDEYTDSILKGVGSRVNPVDFFKKAGVTI